MVRREPIPGGKGLGSMATVWDAEVTVIAEVLQLSKGKRLLILSDSQAAIAAIVKAGRRSRQDEGVNACNKSNSQEMPKRPNGSGLGMGQKPHRNRRERGKGQGGKGGSGGKRFGRKNRKDNTSH